jgi:hypothetical protein
MHNKLQTTIIRQCLAFSILWVETLQDGTCSRPGPEQKDLQVEQASLFPLCRCRMQPVALALEVFSVCGFPRLGSRNPARDIFFISCVLPAETSLKATLLTKRNVNDVDNYEEQKPSKQRN